GAGTTASRQTVDADSTGSHRDERSLETGAESLCQSHNTRGQVVANGHRIANEDHASGTGECGEDELTEVLVFSQQDSAVRPGELDDLAIRHAAGELRHRNDIMPRGAQRAYN